MALDSREIRRSFGRAAAGYDAAAVLQREAEAILHEFLDDLPTPPGRILDLGSGTGHGTAALRRRYRRSRVLALDLALPMLKASRAVGSWWRPLSLICARAEALPLAESSLDLVVSNLCLQWCPDLPRVLAELRRVLRPGASLIFSSFGPETLWQLRAAWSEVDDRPHVIPFVDLMMIGDALLAAGFKDPVLFREHRQRHYADSRELMLELKALGAHNAHPGRSRSLTGKGRITRMNEAYERERVAAGLPATFELLFAKATAPAPGAPIREGGADIARFPIDSLRGSRRR